METKLLLPNRFKRIGWIIFIPCLVLTILSIFNAIPSISFFESEHILSKWTKIGVFNKGSLDLDANTDIAGEILMTLTSISFFFVAFSRERTDDEWIMKVRLSSLLWAFYAHIAGFLVATWFSYGLAFYIFLSFNMLIGPIVFLVRFHWIVYIKPYLEEKRAA